VSAIPLKDAIEQLAQAVEKAAPADLPEIYTELFPSKRAPEVSDANAAALTQELARHIRTGIEPEEVVDLRNVIFPSAQNVYYDEEERTLRQNEPTVRSAGS